MKQQKYEMDLKDKIAIVTGSSSGIGLATARVLLGKGAKVAGWSRSGTDINDPNFRDIKVDVRDFESVQEGFEQTKKAFGEDIRILINNAGLGWEGYLEKFDHSKWKQMFETNVDGIFYCSQLALPKMRELREGHIVNIASIAGLTGIRGMTGYCATKHAVRGLSHSLYKEIRNFGIKVTCIYPGSVRTHFFDEIDSVELNDNMMRPEDIAGTIIHTLETHPNYHQVDIEVRPLMPKGKAE